MTEHNGLPVKGYQPQSDEKVALVNRFKEMEERLLRELDALNKANNDVINDYVAMHPLFTEQGHPDRDGWKTLRPVVDPGLLVQARDTLVTGFMLLNRSVFQPGRVKLPEDEPHLAEEVRAALNDITG